MREICHLLNIPLVQPTVGSSVPRIFFDDIATHMGLSVKSTMPATARTIIESVGLEWREEFSSENTTSGGGGTVTKYGLLQVKNAIQAWKGYSVDTPLENYLPVDWVPSQNWLELRGEIEREDSLRMARPGSAEFRSLMLSIYGTKCAVSGVNVKEVLEVAHVVPYHGSISDNPQNAIVLRSDLHQLFDTGLMQIEFNLSDRTYRTRVHDFIFDDYGSFNNSKVLLPEDNFFHVSKIALEVKRNLHLNMWQTI